MTNPAISFEFFPPKTDAGRQKLLDTHAALNDLAPQYFSVTYGAGGSTRKRTLDVIDALSRQSNTPIVPHLSCIGDSKAQIGELLDHYQEQGINQLVALRGDLPSGQVGMGELPFAVDLIHFVREHSSEYFDIKVAAYPEMHPQARSFAQDLDNLEAKFKAGANSAITQFFFNADSYFYLRDALEKRGIDTNAKPLVAGIMPIINASNLIRFADGCGADIPRYIRKQLADYGDDRQSIRQFGMEVVQRLCERLLADGVPALHFYTMNRVSPNKEVVQALI